MKLPCIVIPDSKWTKYMTESTGKRRETVVSLLNKNMPETKIAEILGVSRQTIIRDVSFLKRSSSSWIDGLAKHDFIFEYKLKLDRIKSRGGELQKLYDETKDTEKKVSILKAMDKNDKLYLEMLGESPTVHAFRKAVGKNLVQET